MFAEQVLLFGFRLQFKFLAGDLPLGKTPDEITVLAGLAESKKANCDNPVSGIIADDKPAHLIGKRTFLRSVLVQLFEQSFLQEQGPGLIIVRSRKGFVWMVGKVHASKSKPQSNTGNS